MKEANHVPFPFRKKKHFIPYHIFCSIFPYIPYRRPLEEIHSKKRGRHRKNLAVFSTPPPHLVSPAPHALPQALNYPTEIMVNSLAVAAAFCASASAFMAPTPLARAPASQQGGVSFLVLSYTAARMFRSLAFNPSLPLAIVCPMTCIHSRRQLRVLLLDGQLCVLFLVGWVHRRTARERETWLSWGRETKNLAFRRWAEHMRACVPSGAALAQVLQQTGHGSLLCWSSLLPSCLYRQIPDLVRYDNMHIIKHRQSICTLGITWKV